MEVETFYLPLTWLAYKFQIYLGRQLKQGNLLKKIIIWCKYVFSGKCPLNFECILLQVFETSPKFRKVTLLKAIAHRGVKYGLKVPVWYHFQWRKATIGWFQRATRNKRYRNRLKIIAILETCKMKSKKFCFSWIPETFICVRVGLADLSEDRKNLSVWSSILHTVFTRFRNP